MSNKDLEFMKLALREARKGIGRTSPNPAVGAIVVKNGRIIGKGYHKKAGTEHAEVLALRAAGDRAKGSTLYVTLEPCNHTGRTPPCTLSILRSGIQRVVVGMDDPNPMVEGGGCNYLTNNGIDVTKGILKEACEEINLPFIKHITTGLPWIIMKAGISLDGKISARSAGNNNWITNELSREAVHRIRDRCDAIMIGIGTALFDDPLLTTRLRTGKGRDPLRVILDTKLSLSPEAKMLRQASNAETWVFCGPSPPEHNLQALKSAGAVVKQIDLTPDDCVNMRSVFAELGRSGLTSVLVEGGSRIHGSLLRSRLVDQAYLFVAPIFIGGDGISLVDGLGTETAGEAIRMTMIRYKKYGQDLLIEGRFDNTSFSA